MTDQLKTMDARVWAEVFVETLRACPVSTKDELIASLEDGWALSWFANAIMRGWDEAHWKLEPQIVEVRALLREAVGYLVAWPSEPRREALAARISAALGETA